MGISWSKEIGLRSIRDAERGNCWINCTHGEGEIWKCITDCDRKTKIEDLTNYDSWTSLFQCGFLIRTY